MRLSGFARWLLPALLLVVLPASLHAGVFISVGFAPPVLPVYEQPICPEANLMSMPGYWAYGDDGYYWVPGAWVPAPYVGALWTPPYWDWFDGHYRFHDGYWGAHVGYYGGVDYGFGYMGIGFVGGEWRNGGFAYNTAVMRVNTTVIRNTYVDRTIVERNTVANSGHVAYSGGPHGINHAPTAQERIAEHDRHTQPTSFQEQHIAAARADKTAYAKANGGHPSNLVAARPLASASRAAVDGRKTTESRTTTAPRTSARSTTEPRTESRTTTAPRTETHARTETAPRTETHAAAPRTETHARTETAPRTVTHARTETAPRTETHAAAPRTETHARTETTPRTETHARTETAPRTETHAVAPRAETHAAPQARPAAKPSPSGESHAAPKARPAPEPKTEEKKPH